MAGLTNDERCMIYNLRFACGETLSSERLMAMFLNKQAHLNWTKC